jgi:hypothetical protein
MIMKKTFSNIRTLAALLMAGAAFAACSSDDNIIENQQPANPGEQVYTMTINATNGGATTRALDLDGTKLVASWANGDELIVHNQSKMAALGGTLTASNVSADGSTATFSGTLTGTIVAGDRLMLYYNDVPAISDFGNQDGTLKGTNGAEKYDIAMTMVEVSSVNEGNITTTDDANFSTITAMLKLTLQDGIGNALNATSLKISIDGIGDLWTYSPTAATYTDNGDGVLYFAILGADDVAYWKSTTTETLATATVTFTATVGGKTYTVTKPGYKFAAGKYYAATLTMAEVPASLIVSPAVGQVIGDDGVNYADAAAASLAGATAVAKIVYVGSDNGEEAPYNHGLALALSDANGGVACKWSTSNTEIHTYNPTSDSFASESGLQYNDATHNNDTYPAFKAAIANNSTAAPTGCSAWFLASGYQWTKMFAGDADGLKTLAGLQSNDYWSSSERRDDSAWTFYSNFGNWNLYGKDVGLLVRSCLAF